MRANVNTTLADEYASRDSEAVVALILHAHSKRTLEKWLDGKLEEVRERPGEALVWLETVLLRGLSGLGDPGPEHRKQTGREAGGGRLVKGS